MNSPYRWLKVRWYHRQAKRALWFLRYMDRMAHEVGWDRAKVRTMWLDFIKHPGYRYRMLDELSVINKVTINRKRSKQYEIALRDATVTIEKLKADNASLRNSLATNCAGSDNNKQALTEGGIH